MNATTFEKKRTALNTASMCTMTASTPTPGAPASSAATSRVEIAPLFQRRPSAALPTRSRYSFGQSGDPTMGANVHRLSASVSPKSQRTLLVDSRLF
jgi:hypothetical protein